MRVHLVGGVSGMNPEPLLRMLPSVPKSRRPAGAQAVSTLRMPHTRCHQRGVLAGVLPAWQ